MAQVMAATRPSWARRRSPACIGCAVGYVGVYDLQMKRRILGDSARWMGTFADEWMGDDDATLALRLRHPHRRAHKAPVFLAAGGKDDIAPIRHSQKMEKALKAARNAGGNVVLPHGGPRLLHRRASPRVLHAAARLSVAKHRRPEGQRGGGIGRGWAARQSRGRKAYSGRFTFISACQLRAQLRLRNGRVEEKHLDAVRRDVRSSDPPARTASSRHPGDCGPPLPRLHVLLHVERRRRVALVQQHQRDLRHAAVLVPASRTPRDRPAVPRSTCNPRCNAC